VHFLESKRIKISWKVKSIAPHAVCHAVCKGFLKESMEKRRWSDYGNALAEALEQGADTWRNFMSLVDRTRGGVHGLNRAFSKRKRKKTTEQLKQEGKQRHQDWEDKKQEFRQHIGQPKRDWQSGIPGVTDADGDRNSPKWGIAVWERRPGGEVRWYGPPQGMQDEDVMNAVLRMPPC
jgi:hypothetical protein